MASRKTPEQKTKAIELRKTGLCYTEIAKQIGASASWVEITCKKAGLDGRVQHPRVDQMREYKAQGHTMQEVAKKFGVSEVTAQYYCKGIAPQKGICPNPRNQYTDRTQEEIKLYVESFLDGRFSYAGGYINSDHKVRIKCNDCGYEFERSMITIRKRKKTRCENCEKIAKEQELEAMRKAKEEKRSAAREEAKRRKEATAEAQKKKRQADREARKRVAVCAWCGKEFISYNKRVKCCSAECSRKRFNRMSSHKKDHRIKSDKRIDKDITAAKLYERDNGVCWICGKPCDINDYTERNGVIICGDNYPSVDHIKPICEGGTDAWNNVRLAHRYCNSARYWKNVTPPVRGISA